ncbi:MAG: divergent polysaccharide deacetylase family protein [Deltaproteobacteria bacterium]|nr:divergent polysaccharide deacetylase family protein [Deltaproteobacteria bacterium]
MKKRRNNVLTIIMIAGTLIAIATFFYIWNYEPGIDPDSGKEKGEKTRTKEDTAKGRTARPHASYKEKQAVGRNKIGKPSHDSQGIAVIIDDIGGDLESLEELLAIPAPISFAVLPHLAHSVEAAILIHKAGRDVLLHLPMEPHHYPQANPGEGALFVRMSREEIRRQVDADIEAVPYICGVNNHMGSLFMENESKLAVVFEQLKKSGLFFVDSKTTPSNKAEELAAQMDIPFAQRSGFIDNDNNYPSSLERIFEAAEAAQTGTGENIVIIGHPYADTIKALKKAVPLMKARGVDVVPISKLVRGQEAGSGGQGSGSR